MKKILIILVVIFSILLLKFTATYFINEKIITDYNNEKYDTNLINLLYMLNFNESYIVYYNHGNLLYKEKNYEEAQAKYISSLNHHPTSKRVCSIRINLSLSYIATVDENNVEEALETLDKAKKVLYEDNCASEYDDSGKSSEAEELEEEIKQMEEQLKGNESEDSNNNNNDNNNNNQEENQKDEIEEELKEIQKQSQSERGQNMDYYKDLEDFSYYTGKTW